MHYSNNYFAGRGNYFGSKRMHFYDPPKYTPEFELMPGAEVEFRKFGSLTRRKENSLKDTVTTQASKQPKISKINFSLNQVQLPLTRNFQVQEPIIVDEDSEEVTVKQDEEIEEEKSQPAKPHCLSQDSQHLL